MKNKALKISMWCTNIALLLLIIFTVGLPWMVTWYVETMGRSPKLPAIIMVTCYPCVPFVAALLLNLRKLLQNISKDLLFHSNNVIYFKRITIFSIAISVITLIAGRFYLPFYIVGVSFAFFALMVFVFKTIFSAVAYEVDKKSE